MTMFVSDLTNSKEREYCYPKHCKCNKDRCFKDDHCVCVKVEPCPVNQTMDAATGGIDVNQKQIY